MTTELINRLRDTASKGVSVWGDLQTEAAQAIEALQARVAELTRLNETSVPMGAHIAALAELDTAQEKLRELEAQEPVAWVNSSNLISADIDRKRYPGGHGDQYTWRGFKNDYGNTPLYARPVPAAPTARTYMDGYSDGKQWALEQAQPEPVSLTDEQVHQAAKAAADEVWPEVIDVGWTDIDMKFYRAFTKAVLAAAKGGAL